MPVFSCLSDALNLDQANVFFGNWSRFILSTSAVLLEGCISCSDQKMATPGDKVWATFVIREKY